MDKRLEVREWPNVKSRNVPPQIILNLDADDLESLGDTITTILIKGKNGKVARVNLRLLSNRTSVTATVSSDSPNRTTEKSIKALFGWEQHPDDPKAVEFPKGDERRLTPA